MTPAELRAKAKELEVDGLCNPASLDVYRTWYVMGGSQYGPSPMEILEMPAWLRMDFEMINRYISDERDRVKRSKPKKPAKRGRH